MASGVQAGIEIHMSYGLNLGWGGPRKGTIGFWGGPIKGYTTTLNPKP